MPDTPINSTLEAQSQFLNTSLEDWFSCDDALSPENRILSLFHNTAATVPGYNAFLNESKIDPHRVQTFRDIQSLPALTKENYILRYPLIDRVRGGNLDRVHTVAVSSGSTGTPCFWPRSQADEWDVTWRFEQVFADSFQCNKRRTLAVVCFALGTWVGGMYTINCCRNLTLKGYPITVLTPGNKIDEIFRVVSELGPLYDQVVLLGYPPFLKEVIDTGIARGIDWKPFRIKLVMAGEVFSEEWRSLLADRLGSTDICFDSASLYGTADGGVLGNETPLAISIRRQLAKHPNIARELFGESRLPTLVQYDPRSRYFEEIDGQLLFSGDNGIPLIRYNILDRGGVIHWEKMLEIITKYGLSVDKKIVDCARKLPFVYVFGRSDFTVSYFGANIFPENVTVGLEQPGIQNWVSGKFVLETFEDESLNTHLRVTVELMPGETASDYRTRDAAYSIREQLLRLNSEFANYVPTDYQLPEVILLPAGHPDYFPTGVKHRYSRK